MSNTTQHDTTNKGVETAIQIAGSQARLAKLLKVSQAAVSKMLKQGPSATRAMQIERVTGVLRSQTRPDLWSKE